MAKSFHDLIKEAEQGLKGVRAATNIRDAVLMVHDRIAKMLQDVKTHFDEAGTDPTKIETAKGVLAALVQKIQTEGHAVAEAVISNLQSIEPKAKIIVQDVAGAAQSVIHGAENAGQDVEHAAESLKDRLAKAFHAVEHELGIDGGSPAPTPEPQSNHPLPAFLKDAHSASAGPADPGSSETASTPGTAATGSAGRIG